MGFPRGARLAKRGFALIITLTLMALLTILSIGLLSLSTISLRTSSQGDSAARARANARLALMMAIGELQHFAGLDTRVTAKADILDQNNPPVLGVWKSWEGTDHDSSGRPISPGSYESRKQQRFLRWMVSGDNKTLPDTSERSGSVPLVGPHTVGDGGGRQNLQIHLEPVLIKEGVEHGGYAWWVSGENQKARLPRPYEPETDSPARWSVLAKSHSVADPSMFRMDDLLETPETAQKVISHQLSDLVGKPEGGLRVSSEFFHDMSAVSKGLLTNTATGGWRKDLSLMTENWNQLASSNLPFFRATPDKDLMSSKPSSGNAFASRSILYPWSGYRGSGGEMAIYRHGAVSTWENLKDYATAYKRITATSSGRNRIAPVSTSIDGDNYSFIHKVRVLPVVARIQWVFSHFASGPMAPSNLVEPRLLLTPVFTMWNPYSVEINAAPAVFQLQKPLPAALSYSFNGVKSGVYNSVLSGSTNYGRMSKAGSLQYKISSPYVLAPGETRVFSPTGSTQVDASILAPPPPPLELAPGYRAKGGHYFPLMTNVDNDQRMMLSSGTMIGVDAKFDNTYSDEALGVGIFLDMLLPNSNPANMRHLAYRMTYTPEMAKAVYQDLPDLADASLAGAASTPVPFMSAIFGSRMASRTHIPAKGLVQSSPLVNYTAMGNKDTVETTIKRHYNGTRHPVNSPFDFSFVEHTAGGDSYLPNSEDSSQRGYIVTGFLKGDGLSRCVLAEIPVRPLLSLGELQNWDLRYENPVPPFAFNLIGNSAATPLIPANAVVDSGNAAPVAVNLQHDDSYCANHVLFDDWFFSSIAPDPSNYGTSGKTLQQTFTSFVTGEKPLGNAAYRPIREDAGADAAKATKIYDTYVKGTNAWKSVASRIEVDGMFNVNSTSVIAWQALLGHARDQKVPYIKEAGGAWSVDTSEELDHPFSRFSIAGDAEAGKGGSSGNFAEATEFAGFRTLDEDLIEELAREIVEQVRERGPFLSLSEFVNRQLSSGELALAGAVQTALDQLAKKGASNPYSIIQGLSKDAVSNPDRPQDAEYRFPAAAAGESAYGLPGWTRQADVLRPLAPILSARDDTFTIRAHGDARDDKGVIISRAMCEAVVQRSRDYVDGTDAADLATAPTKDVNKAFGRRFSIVSFRWLSPSEI
ncbi:hypothetical protein [Luteolibacter sp. Populi]|uniref:hypothetical protein n=1 Tax=Luteolibacter sp. Populi TaxID=3230487 RepID=UPI00346717A9